MATIFGPGCPLLSASLSSFLSQGMASIPHLLFWTFPAQGLGCPSLSCLFLYSPDILVTRPFFVPPLPSWLFPPPSPHMAQLRFTFTLDSHWYSCLWLWSPCKPSPSPYLGLVMASFFLSSFLSFTGQFVDTGRNISCQLKSSQLLLSNFSQLLLIFVCLL